MPVDVDSVGCCWEEILHSVGADGEVHHIGIGQQLVVEIDIACTVGGQPHRHCTVGHIGWSEVKVFGQNVFVLSFESEVHARVFFVKQLQRLTVLTVIIF